MEDRYEHKYNLLLQKYAEIEFSNEKLQNRIYHIRKQVRYLRRLKRILQQKLGGYGDRFMDVCLEIPDMEPGANVEDQIIRRVAEVPHGPTTPHGQQQTATARASQAGMINSSFGNAVPSNPSSGLPPPKKRRRATITQDDSGTVMPTTPVTAGADGGRLPSIGRAIASQQRKSLAAQSAASMIKRCESMDGSHYVSAAVSCTTGVHHYQVPASVEDVVNSVVFDCQQQQRSKDDDQKQIKCEIPTEQAPVEAMDVGVSGMQTTKPLLDSGISSQRPMGESEGEKPGEGCAIATHCDVRKAEMDYQASELEKREMGRHAEQGIPAAKEDGVCGEGGENSIV